MKSKKTASDIVVKDETLSDNAAPLSIAQVETPSVPMVDSGTGKASIIRKFDIVLPPSKNPPTSEEILEHQMRFITSLLLKDGLEQIGDAKIVQEKKLRYFIFVPAQPRMTQILMDKPTTLQQVFNDRNRNKTR